MALDILLLSVLVYIVLWTVMTTRLLRSVMGLALTSVMLTIIMFRFNAPLAAVFELSVCAGLIFVIFITTVSFTQRVSKERFEVRRRERFEKFWALPIIIILAGAFLFQVNIPLNFQLPSVISSYSVNSVLWNFRQVDLLGQIVILLAGAFGVVMLFKEKGK
ncbi:MAG: hypothetical protein WC890_05385 [Candidatus Margulisiibacteriota bacterium]